MLKLAYKVGSRGGAMVSPSARNAGDPWFESRSWYDRFLYVNIHLFILMPVSCKSSILQKYLALTQESIYRSKKTETNKIKMATVHRLVKEPKIIGSPMAGNNRSEE